MDSYVDRRRCNTRMVIHMKVSGIEIRRMEMEYI
jgi:hypothetical protein